MEASGNTETPEATKLNAPEATKLNAPKTVTIRFLYDRDTAATYRWHEVREIPGLRPTVGTLYMTKDFINQNGWATPEFPANLEVTIRVVE